MKAISLAAALAALVCSAGFATNGSYLIGLSPASQGQGGVGVANFTSTSDALYKNPAMLGAAPGEVGKVSAEVMTSLIKPNVTGFSAGAGTADSSAGARFLPGIAGRYKFSDKLSIGLGAFAYGGNAVDYKGTPALFELQNEEHLNRIALGASYEFCPWFTLGVTPFLTWGQISVNEDILSAAKGAPVQTSRGLSGATGAGVQIGVSSKPMDHLTVGASFTTKQSLNYKQVLDLDLFGSAAVAGPIAATGNSVLDDIALEQPAEIAAGLTYTGLDKFTFSFDYRYIGWGHADVYRELQWHDQHAFGLGGSYHMDAWDFRLGVNFSTGVIDNTVGDTGTTLVNLSGHNVESRRVSMFDALLFPAYTNTHITTGAGYKLTESLKLDAAFVFVPKATISRAGSGGELPGEAPQTNYAYSSSHSQWEAVLGASYQF